MGGKIAACLLLKGEETFAPGLKSLNAEKPAMPNTATDQENRRA
jgi:hypothetical protein